jgi:type VI protein secretion system component VasK
VFVSGDIADRFLALAGLLLVLLVPRRSASETYGKWHERAVLAILAVCACKLAWWAWKSFTRDDRALLATVGLLAGAIMLFGALAATVSRRGSAWHERREWRSYEKDPNRAGREAYAKWLKGWDETSAIKQRGVRPERKSEQL